MKTVARVPDGVSLDRNVAAPQDARSARTVVAQIGDNVQVVKRRQQH